MVDDIHEPDQRPALGVVLEPAVLGHAGLAQEGVALGRKLGLELTGEFVVLDPVVADVWREVVLNVAERQRL